MSALEMWIRSCLAAWFISLSYNVLSSDLFHPIINYLLMAFFLFNAWVEVEAAKYKIRKAKKNDH